METEQKAFDLVVTHRDEKTGQVTHKNPYILRVRGEGGGEKSRFWERPAGSGNLWNKKGEPVGRWEAIPGETNKGRPVMGVVNKPHVEFVAPLTSDQKLANSVVQKDSRIAELERELAAVRAEESKKSEVKKPQAAVKAQTAG
jgi:uncharacterized small protein (DUF1192 family)